MNADGTIYSRYGTQSEAGADAYNSVESLEKTMRRVLTLHANAANYKKYLAGKRGKPNPGHESNVPGSTYYPDINHLTVPQSQTCFFYLKLHE